MPEHKSVKPKFVFTKYQKFIIVILALIQFTVVLDFMVLSPLGAILLPALNIKTHQFGIVVSAYAFSAGISGFLAAGFADKFDRKKMLLFFYLGFIVGTALCALATDYTFLLFARIFTGIFGGVISSIGFAIITDLFSFEQRGRVMGFVQMAFAVSQVIGIPVSLYLANHFSWHAPFWLIVIIAILMAFTIYAFMKPINEHLKIKSDKNPILHLWHTISKIEYLKGFLATVMLATGGFMLMPFSSAFTTQNLGIDIVDLPIIYGVTGICSMIAGPLIGKASDSWGKYSVFVIGSIISIIMVLIYTNMGVSPLWMAVLVNVILFVGITSRMISSSALITGVPKPEDRGAFMSINSSIQQVSGGIASAIAGIIVYQDASNKIVYYNRLGYIVVFTMLLVVIFMYMLNKQVMRKVK
jgi:predicted MFS family arabinose efflux permease